METTQNITVSAGGTYTVTVTDGNGCTGTASQAVTVNSNPTPTITAGGTTTFCAGGSVLLTATAAATYSWSTTETTQAITVSVSGTYTVTVTDGSGCTGTASQAVTVNSNPTPTITAGGPTTFCAGGSVTLTSSAASSYSWSTAETTQAITASAGGTYTVTVTDGNGCTGTASQAVTVNSNPTPTITAGGPTTFCAGGSVTLTSSLASSYSWSTTETTQAITVSATGTYTVTVTDGNGCTGTASQAVTVNSNPTPTITAGGPTTFCAGGSVTLTSSLASSYSWSTTETTQAITASAGGTYTVTVTDGNGCTGTASQVIIVDAPPTANAGSDATVCSGSNYTLSGTRGGSATSSLWTTSGDGGFGDATLLTTAYTPGVTDISMGNVTLTLTTDDPVGPCPAASDAMILFVVASNPQIYIVTITSDAGAGSLRQAIIDANANCGHDTIIFNLGAGGPFSIAITSALPDLTDNAGVTIDGWNNSGNDGTKNTVPVFSATTTTPLNPVYKIILGNNNNVATGLVLASDSNEIKGLVLQDFGDGVPSGNDIAITISGNANQIRGCYIGMDANGTVRGTKTAKGILITGVDNKIGKGDAANANLISGINGNLYGIQIMGAGATGNTIEGNMIGLQKDGSTIVAGAMQMIGVEISSGAFSNSVGGSNSGEGNVISGNNNTGVYLNSAAISGNSVQGNIIGPMADGASLVASNPQQTGVSISDAPNNIIGGNSSIERNIISANQSSGIQIGGAGSAGNLVQGNYIGTDSSGTLFIANSSQDYGVMIQSSSAGNTIGGTGTGEGNLISGNSNYGIFISNAGAAGNLVVGNTIGTQLNGSSVLTTNLQSYGIYIGNSPNNVIGGNSAGERNIISGNLFSGTYFSGSVSTGNSVKGNYIGTDSSGTLFIASSSQDYGIDIGSSAVNNFIGGSIAGEGNLISGNTNSGIRLTTAEPSGNTITGNIIGTQKNGTSFLTGNMQSNGIYVSGSSNNIIGGSTAGEKNIISANETYGVLITGATATGNIIKGNYLGIDKTGTSFITGSTQDYGVYIASLATSNIIGGSGAGEGNVISGNKNAFNTGSGIYINSTAAGGNSVLGNIIGPHADGVTYLASNAQNSGIFIYGSQNNIIGGNTPGAGNVISGNENQGIFISWTGSSGNSIKGNYIGIDKNGASVITGSNQDYGIFLQGTAGGNNSIGGSSAGDGNLISGNTVIGIFLSSANASGSTIAGNIIGPQADGKTYLASNLQARGIEINGSPNNIIGGNTAGARNIISANENIGIYITGAGSTGNVIKGNYIGIDSIGATFITGSTQDFGVYFTASAASNTVGGSGAGEGNVISGNKGASVGYGIALASSAAAGNTILGNIIGPQADGISYLTANAQTHGIDVWSSPNNTIGGNTAGTRNIISANETYGIHIYTAGSSGNVVKGNYIGPGSALANIANSSQDYGVYLESSAANNTIGGNSAGEENQIAFNTVNGVYLFNLTTTGNKISGNPIYSNTGKAINLNIGANQGNGGKAAPAITAAVTVMVKGTSSANDTIELFKNTTGSCNDAVTFVGQATADGGGNWSLPVSLTASDYVLATARDASNNTSEFSPCQLIAACNILTTTAKTDESCNGASNGKAAVIAANGTPPYSYLWDDLLSQTNDTATGLTAGIYRVTVTDANTCSAVDSVTVNAPSALAGTYTIGGVLPDYSTFTAAVADLICKGVSGTVTFNVRDGTYNEQITITAIPGASTVNNIRFQSENNDSSLVVLSFSSSLANNFTLKLNNADYVTFRKMTLKGINATYGRVIDIGGGANYNKFLNCGIIGVVASTFKDTLALVYSSSGDDDNNEFNNNLFLNGSQAFYYFGQSTLILESGTVITGNIFSEQYYAGIHLENQDAPLVSSNVLSTTLSSLWGFIGIQLQYCDNASMVTTNKINTSTADGYGIFIRLCDGTSGSPALVANNFVQIGASTTTDGGIYVENSNYINVYHNSVNVTSSDISSIGLLTVATGPQGNVNILNNNIVNSGGGYAVAVNNATGVNQLNNNNYFTTGAQLGRWEWIDYANLSGWKTASGKDANSVSVNPYFASAVDLHLSCSSPDTLKNGANLSAVVSNDFDNDTRSTTPWMGGDERLYLSLASIVSNTDVTCNGDNNGSITVSASAGTPPYQYSRDGGSSWQIGNSFSGLIAGTYPVVVTDSNNCLSIPPAIVITEPSAVVVTETHINISCSGGINGSIDITPSGGTGSFTYVWSDGPATEDRTAISANTYTVTVTDANNCQQIISVVITEPPPFSVTVTKADVACSGDSSGSATANPSGGVPPYTFVWNDPAPAQLTQTATGLPAGTWMITVNDSNSCNASTSVTIAQPASLSITMNNTPDTCPGAPCDGSAIATVTGGVSAYTYTWSNGAMGSSSINNVCAGTYTVIINDNNGCTEIDSTTVPQPNTSSTDPVSIAATGDSLCPGDSVILSVQGGSLGSGASWKWYSGFCGGALKGNGDSIAVAPFSTTTYFVRAEGSCNTTTCVSRTVTVSGTLSSAPSGITATVSAICEGNSTTLNITGGTLGTGATWQWYAGSCGGVFVGTSNAISVSPVATTTYYARAEGICNTTTCASITITVNPNSVAPTGILASTDSICPGDSTVLTVQGGVLGAGATWKWYSTSCGSGASIMSGTSITVSPLVTTSYYVRAEGTCDTTICVSITIYRNTLSPNPITTIAIPGQICIGDTATLVSSPGSLGTGAGWFWYADTCGGTFVASGNPINVSPTVTTTYFIRAEGICNTTVCNNVTVTVNPVSSIQYPVSICDGDSAFISGNWQTAPGIYTDTLSTVNGCDSIIETTLSVNPVSGIQYPVSICTGDSIFLQDAYQTTAGVYYDTLSTVNGCDSIIETTLTVNPVSSIQYPESICQGDSIYLAGGWKTAPGNYIDSLQTVFGCDSIVTTTLTVNPVPAAATSKTDVTCFGLCDGTAGVIVSGGSPPYNYVWSNGQNNPLVSALCASVFTITVSDSSGCVALDSVSITEPSNLTAQILAITDVSCFGDSNGTATASGVGGSPPYSYSWSNGDTDSATAAVGSGSYTITVIDMNSCTDTAVAVITQPAQLIVNAIDSADIQCKGDSTGVAYGAVTGGSTPYTYYWSDPAMQITPAATGLSAGLYTVIVNDANGCVSYDSVNITEPATVLSFAITNTTDPVCFNDSNGTITGQAAGGVIPYTFNWTGPVSGNAVINVGLLNVNSLPGGNYFINVTDAAGCIRSDSAILVNPPLITLSFVFYNVSCFGGNDGAINLTALNGAPPYTYNWSNGETANNIDTLTAGFYTITVTDSKSCSNVAVGTITEPPALNVSVSITNATCGLADGSATASATGGSGSYAYDWSDGQTVANAAGLANGNYTVTVTDSLGCTVTGSASVGSSGGPVAFLAFASVSCFGACDGSASADSVSGGTPPYTYNWSDGSTGSVATAVCSGGYTVTISDFNSCIFIDSVSVTEPAAISMVISITNSTCGNADGSAAASASGGNGTFTYNWSNGQSGPAATGLAAATYTVTVQDISGCTITGTAILSDSNGPSAVLSSVPVSCYGMCDGSAIADSITGGTPPYAYNWSDGSTGSVAVAVCSGTYSISISDNNGCKFIDSVLVTEPPSILISVSTTNSSCGTADGSATATASGGNGLFTYVWSDGQSDSVATGLAAGNYVVTATDFSGCSATAIAAVSDTGGPAIVLTQTGTSCSGGSDGAATVTTTGGAPPYTYLWDDPSSQTDSVATGLSAGIYSIIVEDTIGCISTDFITVTEPTAISKNFTIIDATCDSSDGSVIVAVAGGSGNYTYLWNTGASTDTLQGISAGTYTVTVFDSNGCSDSATVAVGETGCCVLATSMNITSGNLCNGDSSGSAKITISSGTPPYTFTWSSPLGNSTDSIISNLPAGNYGVTITDQFGCTDTLSFTVTQPTAISFTIDSIINVTCNGGNDGGIYVTVSGGTLPYNTLAWFRVVPYQLVGLNEDLTGMIAGWYALGVIDGNGCRDSLYIGTIITQPPAIINSIITTAVPCSSQCTATASVVLNSPDPSVSYQWDNGQSAQAATGLCMGNYFVTVTDTTGCSDTGTAVVTSAGLPKPVVSPLSFVYCIGDTIDSLRVQPQSGGVIVWYSAPLPSNAVDTGNAYLPGPSIGDNIYYVREWKTPCESEVADILVTLHEQPLAQAGDDRRICIGDFTTLHATGGISYHWFPPKWLNDTAIAEPRSKPSDTIEYFVTVTDINGCTADDSVTVFVDFSDNCFHIYNMFSPNGDGNNDLWVIDGISQFPENKITIYSRFEDKLVEFLNYNNENVVWGGENKKGDPLPAGTYFYVVDIGVKKFTGWVQVIR
ncbi:MAG: gliding motility-associated C-terminal domain-containing protein [Bacteroidetes bacterium]|nr:gliding motility-associated C-terminal domain-containing protein [Bacteroidota bacterium]